MKMKNKPAKKCCFKRWDNCYGNRAAHNTATFVWTFFLYILFIGKLVFVFAQRYLIHYDCPWWILIINNHSTIVKTSPALIQLTICCGFFFRFLVPLQIPVACQCRGWKSKMLCQVRIHLSLVLFWDIRSLTCPSTFRFPHFKVALYLLCRPFGCLLWCVWSEVIHNGRVGYFFHRL